VKVGSLGEDATCYGSVVKNDDGIPFSDRMNGHFHLSEVVGELESDDQSPHPRQTPGPG
jgi:hypothetical protein